MNDRALTLLTLLFFASEVALALSKRSRRTVGATRADRGSAPVLWIVISLAIVAAFSLSGSVAGRLPFSPATIRAAAFVLFAGGAAVRWWAVVTLGRFFTVDVATHDGHRLIDKGPFRFVRHPSYSGLLLEFLGLGVSLGSARGLVVLMVPIVVALSYRMKVEEAALRRALGASYEAYSARTKRLIPGLI